MTVRKAVDMLIEWGLVERRHGSGTYVTKKDVQHETKGLSGFTELMREQGRRLTSEVLEFRTMPAPPAIASQLRIKVNEPVYFSTGCARWTAGPCWWRRATCRCGCFAPSRWPIWRIQVRLHRERVPAPHRRQLRELQRRAGRPMHGRVAAHRAGAPILRLTSLSYGENGEFLNYSIMFRNANDYHVDYHLRRFR